MTLTVNPKSFAILIMLAILFQVCAFSQVPLTIADFPATTSEVPIKSWQLAGPLFFDAKELQVPNAETAQVGLGRARDFLESLGLSERLVDASSFSKITEEQNVAHPTSKFRNQNVDTEPVNHVFSLGTAEESMQHSVLYMAAIIDSPRDQEIAIAAGVTGNMQLWLNHEKLIADRYSVKYYITKFQHIVGAKLKKGKNFLLVKIGYKEDWYHVDLIVSLFPYAHALDLAIENAVNPILPNSIVETGQQLELRGDLLSQPNLTEFQIADFSRNLVALGKFTNGRSFVENIGSLKRDQLYFCTASIAGRQIERPFYYGNLDREYEKLSQQANEIDHVSDSVRMDLQAQLGRLRHLLQSESRKSPFWDEKVVGSIAEIVQNFADLHKGEADFLHAPGTHLRGYRSAVDEQTQHYWIHVPSKALNSGRPIPLVIILPYDVGKKVPFLESYFVASFDNNESYKTLGDEYGFAVLQEWGRGDGAGGTAIGTTDIFEALEAVQRDYNIDSERIYLMGYCEGGRRALLMAERYPNRFAAIAAEHPIVDFHSKDLWSEYSSPITSIQNLVDIPVFISHDEAEPDPTFLESELFASRCRNAGVNITLVRRSGAGNIHGFSQAPTAEKRAFFDFFNGKSLATVKHTVASTNPSLRRFGIGAGPIEDAFGGPILLVEGTGGTSEQNLANQGLVRRFRGDWQEAYFVDCPWKKDIEVTAEDLRDKNLILVGDEETNSLLKRMAGKLPIQRTRDGISVEGKVINGTQLGYVFVAPNPLNHEKYIVEIGMNYWKEARGWNFPLARSGVCDFFVFDLQGAHPRQLDAGYFDAAWNFRKNSPQEMTVPTDKGIIGIQ